MSHELATMIARDIHVLSVAFIALAVAIGAAVVFVEWKNSR